MRRLFLIACLILITTGSVAAKDWRGIVPLHSTRATVEALLDPPGQMACGMPFDEYGDIRFSDEKARLDNFAYALVNSENTKGYIIVYAGRKAVAAEAQTRANRARNYLINLRHVDPNRVVTVDGGYAEQLIVILSVVPPGVTPPAPTSKIDPKDVEIIYEKPRTRRRRRHQN